MTAKARGKKSVLNRQKPKKARKPLPLKLRVRRWAIGGCVVLGLVGAVWGAWRLRKLGNELTIAMAGSPTQWHVSLKLADDLALTDKAQDDIISTTKRLAGRGTHDELVRAAQAVQQLGSYADVHVLKLSGDQLAVQVRQRTPFLCIEADRLRLISTTGEVYGQVEQNLVANCPGAVVSGIFDPGLRLPMRSDLTLSLSEDESALVHEAVQLSREAHERGFAISRMESKRFRGFLVTLAGQDTEVAIGRAPFAAKLERLQTILARQAAKNQQAQRIELDYQGKAFIKLKKM